MEKILCLKILVSRGIYGIDTYLGDYYAVLEVTKVSTGKYTTTNWVINVDPNGKLLFEKFGLERLDSNEERFIKEIVWICSIRGWSEESILNYIQHFHTMVFFGYEDTLIWEFHEDSE
jgi:hypothetical protein